MNRKTNEEDEVSFDEELEATSDESELARAARKSSRQKKDLEVCLEQKQEYLDGWQRARADLLNERKQFELKRQEIASAVEQAFAADLLKVLDSFDMAFANRDAWERVESNWRTGVEYIQQQLLAALAEHAVTSFSPEGELFNPQEHESVSLEMVTHVAEEGKIVRVLQRGYRYRDKVFRPAKVVVGHYEK